MAALSFFKNMTKDHKVGAFFASSIFAARRIVKEIEPEYKTIVEYGPGDGAVTKEILKVLPPDGKLLAVELNPAFIADLEKIKDSRLTVISEDVIDFSKKLESFGPVDMVISSIPFSFLKPEERESVITHTYKALNPGGKILLFQYRLLMLAYLKKAAGKKIRRYFEPRNIFPYWIMVAEK